MSKFLTREQMLKAPNRQYEEVPVPEWGGIVRVRGLTGRERDAFEATMTIRKGGREKSNMANFRARLVAICVVDEHDNLVFSTADVNELGEQSAGALQRVFNAAQRLSNMTDDDVDELAADFGVAVGAASTSD